MKKQQFLGWVCRTWTETSENGWTSSFDHFNTEEEAHEHGRTFVSLITFDETAREYEVYKHFSDPF